MNKIMYAKYIATALVILAGTVFPAQAEDHPNIIMIMADDMGWGDSGFNGNTIIKTTNLDTMAAAGANLTRFHAGAPVCSPTRGTFLTGRHYFRYGIYTANIGHLPKQEITLARMLKSKGYTTGHFGKWHLGMLDKRFKHNPRSGEAYAPPWERDYDRSFVTKRAVQTWNPGEGNQAKGNPFYDDGVALRDDGANNLRGGVSRIVMDRAIPFIRNAVAEGKPFFAVIWFHVPHGVVVAGPEYLEMYAEHDPEARHYYGTISEMDEQIGRLRRELDELGVAQNTIQFFTSDNGPQGEAPSGRDVGSTGGLRGRKRSLYEGGIRVPSLVVWPGTVAPGTTVDVPLSTLDYFPTIQALVGYRMRDDRPIDGIDMTEIIKGKQSRRPKGIPFRHSNFLNFIEGDYKVVISSKRGRAEELYNLRDDRAESRNLIDQMPERAAELERKALAFLASAQKSHAGEDYNDPAFTPANAWKKFK